MLLQFWEPVLKIVHGDATAMRNPKSKLSIMCSTARRVFEMTIHLAVGSCRSHVGEKVMDYSILYIYTYYWKWWRWWWWWWWWRWWWWRWRRWWWWWWWWRWWWWWWWWWSIKLRSKCMSLSTPPSQQIPEPLRPNKGDSMSLPTMLGIYIHTYNIHVCISWTRRGIWVSKKV